VIVVAKAVKLPTNDPLLKDSLPPNYSFLVESKAQAIIEPALMWLCHSFPPIRGQWRKTTVSNAAYDLCDWWRFLEGLQRAWTDVSEPDLCSYRDERMSLISTHTHEHLDTETIRHRMLTVIAFYRWAQAEGYYSGPPLGQPATRDRIQSLDSNPFAHLGSRRPGVTYHSVPRSKASSDDQVRPLTTTEWRAITQELGPLPSENDPRPSRDRLTAEMSIFAGPRVEEVCSISLAQILALPDNDPDPDAVVALHLTKTKGGRPRKILIPMHLVRELIRYTENEREECLTTGRRFGLRNASEALFVNGVDSRHNAGKPVHPQTISLNFHKAVLRAGFASTVQKHDPLTGEDYADLEANHSFHDLRHTFACLLYEAERYAGNPEPWKTVQARLGHRHLQTTVDTYLRVVDTFRTEVNATVYRFIRSWVSA
jgi:integrase